MTRAGTTWPPPPAFIHQPHPAPACRGHDPDLWFRKTDQEEAKTICGTCPHEQPCRTWAHAQPLDRLYGVWGGTTHDERRHHHQQRKALR
ncbi:WhiB family transcriptional regulator [Micromonospora aurantiaca (nom. illeg.)]|uniref:WhiB family transcriptional regulator n=1 Tax=Micromonospora aurantiaca (nom. illeg.) TaxID=47850 RepID=UPI0037A96390